MKYVLLLTGCVNPQGMAQTALTDAAERQRQYEEAVRWYLSHTSFPVVFAENSGHPLTDVPASDRFEQLSFAGNADKQRGKGYGELEIIGHALSHSRFIQSDTIVIKITGRLIVRNIRSLVRLHRLYGRRDCVMCQLHSDLRFADSRVFTASADFLHQLFSQRDRLDDSWGFYFEHLLADNLRGRFLPYLLQPEITGQSGTTGEMYEVQPTSLRFRWRYFRYQIHLYRKMRA